MLKFLAKVIVVRKIFVNNASFFENSPGANMLAYYQVCYYCVNANCSAHSLSVCYATT